MKNSNFQKFQKPTSLPRLDTNINIHIHKHKAHKKKNICMIKEHKEQYINQLQMNMNDDEFEEQNKKKI